MGSVKYDDDEQIIATNDDNKDLLGESLYGVASTIPLKFNNEPKVPTQDTNYKLLISLMAGKRVNTMNKNSSGSDIVIVIDISESMEHRKFEQMKQALLFLIRKFTPSERISIVTFASNPERKFNLRQMNRNFREEIEVLVRNLSINKGGNTDIVLGLKEGLRILDERKYFSGRCGGVILMSDGMQMDKENRDPIMVVVDRFPVFTFGFGTQGEYNAQVLNEIAKNSKGGTFSVANPGNLSIVFSECLGSVLSAHVPDVKLILRPLSDKVNKREKVESKIIKVYAGKYPQIRDESTGELTILFGNLYLREMHTLLVHLFLPAVTEEVDLDALEITCTYRGESGDLTSTNPALFRVTRTNTPDTKQIHADDTDILQKLILDMMNEAVYNLEEARNKAVEAQSLLDEFDLKKPNPIIEPLKHDVNELVKYLPTEERYINNGRRAITSYYGTTSRTPKLMVRSSSSMQQHPLLAMNMRSPLMVSKTFKEASIISPTLLRFSLAC